MSAVVAWGCLVVGIGLFSSIWLIGLIVEEDPFNRIPVALSNEGNLAKSHRVLNESHRVGDGDLAFGVVTSDRRPSAALLTHPETPHSRRGLALATLAHRATDPLGGF